MLFATLALILTSTPYTLAAPGLTAVDLEAKRVEFLSDYLAQELARVGAGQLQVLSQAQVAALLGLERQRQLLGCADDACSTELAGALGSEGLLLGSIAKLGERYTVSLQILTAQTGARRALVTEDQLELEELPRFLSRAAKQLVDQLLTGASAIAPSTATTDDNLLRLSTVGVEYDRRLTGALWLGGALIGFAFFNEWNGQYAQAFLAQALAVFRYHPLTRETRFAWGVFAAVGFTTAYRADTAGPTLQLGAEVGYRWVRLSLALAGSFTSRTFHLGLIPALTVAIPF